MPDVVVKKIVECTEKGMTIRAIADTVGCSPTIVQKYKKQYKSGELDIIDSEAKQICNKLDKELEERKVKYLDKMSDAVTTDLEKLVQMQPDDLEQMNEKYEVLGKMHKIGKDIYNIGNSGGGINVNLLSAVKVEKDGSINT